MTDVWVWKERTKRTAFRKDCPDTTSITWALMQLHIRQHLHIMLATVRLFVKYCLLINNKCGWSGAAFLASFTLIQRFPRSVTEICVSNVCVCVSVPLCWPSWWSCWRAQWPCRSKCWEGRASWWLATCSRRSVKGLHDKHVVGWIMRAAFMTVLMKLGRSHESHHRPGCRCEWITFTFTFSNC